MMVLRAYIAISCFVLLSILFPLHAQEQTSYRADYNIAFGGFDVAQLTMRFTVKDDTYFMSAHATSQKVARIFSTFTAVINGAGYIEDGQLMQQRIWMQAREDEAEEEEGYYELAFNRDGKPVSLIRNGKLFERDEDEEDEGRINPIKMQDVPAATVHPFSLTVHPIIAAGLKQSCNAKMKLYDGTNLSDLKWQFIKFYEQGAPDYTDKAMVRCVINWKPRRGYRPRTLEFAEEYDRPVEIWYAQIDDLPFMAPIRMNVQTRYGYVVVKATRFFTPETTEHRVFSIDDPIHK